MNGLIVISVISWCSLASQYTLSATLRNPDNPTNASYSFGDGVFASANAVAVVSSGATPYKTVHIFRRNGVAWPIFARVSEQEYLSNTFGIQQSGYGRAIALNEQGTILVVGDFGVNRAFIYYSGTDAPAYTTFNQGTGGFGHAVAASKDTVVVTRYAGPGAVWVYVKTSSGFVQQFTVQPGGASFGWSVALDGDTMAVGENAYSSNRGAIHVYQRVGTTWTRVGFIRGQNSDSQLGWELTLKGRVLAAGCGLESGRNGAMYIYEKNLFTFELKHRFIGSDAASKGWWFGNHIDMTENVIVVSANPGVGAWIYQKNATTGLWVETQRLLSQNMGSLGSRGVAINRDTIFVPSIDHFGGSVFAYTNPNLSC